MSEAIQTESPEVHPLEFEPIPREKITIWRGREVEAFPHNPFYKSSYSIDFDKILRERPSKKPHPYFCGACRLDLVDFFSHFKVEPLDMACIDYEND